MFYCQNARNAPVKERRIGSNPREVKGKNIIKNNMTHEEFVSYCKLISENMKN